MTLRLPESIFLVWDSGFMTRREEALQALRDAVVIALQDGASEEDVRRELVAGIAEAEAARPRGPEALAAYRDRYRPAA
jgi:hypothetical protein